MGQPTEPPTPILAHDAPIWHRWLAEFKASDTDICPPAPQPSFARNFAARTIALPAATFGTIPLLSRHNDRIELVKSMVETAISDATAFQHRHLLDDALRYLIDSAGQPALVSIARFRAHSSIDVHGAVVAITRSNRIASSVTCFDDPNGTTLTVVAAQGIAADRLVAQVNAALVAGAIDQP